MAEVRDISSVRELRSASFSELFYEVLDSPDGHDIAISIVKRIDPEFEEPGKESTAHSEEELLSLKEELEQFRAEAESREREYFNTFIKSPGQIQYMEWLQGMHESTLSTFMLRETEEDMPESCESTETNGVLDYSKVDYSAMLDRALSNGMARLFILEYVIAYSSRSYDRFMGEIDARLKGPTKGPAKKHLAALLLLPKLEDDQDIIVFFGNNFHKSLEEVNAYTGLLYAYEYFEYVGMA